MRLIEELSAVEEDGEGTTPEEKLEKLFLEMDEDDSKFLTYVKQ